MEQVHQDRRADLRRVEKVRDVKADKVGLQAQDIAVVVEHPTQRSSSAPAFQARSQT